MDSFVSLSEMDKQREYISKINSLLNNKNKRAFVITLGCQQNEADSEKISALLTKMGYEMTEDEKNSVSHRANALKAFAELMKTLEK